MGTITINYWESELGITVIKNVEWIQIIKIITTCSNIPVYNIKINGYQYDGVSSLDMKGKIRLV